MSPQCRGKSIGSRLFKAMLTELDQKQVNSFLTVDPGNDAAVALYKRWGYEIKEHVAGFYRANEDRFVMYRNYTG